MKPFGVILAKISGFHNYCHLGDIILQVKSDDDSKNEICKRISQRLGVVLVGFNIDGVVVRKIFIFFHVSRVGYRSRG